jgi:hypothetical protein
MHAPQWSKGLTRGCTTSYLTSVDCTNIAHIPLWLDTGRLSLVLKITLIRGHPPRKGGRNAHSID